MPNLYKAQSHPIADKQALEAGFAVVVLGGYVWEHSIDKKTGQPTSDLRPHYSENQEGYPKGGYPDLEEIRKAHMAAVAKQETTQERAERLKAEMADLAKEIAKLEGKA